MGQRAPYKCAKCKRQLVWHCDRCDWVVCLSESCLATYSPRTNIAVSWAQVLKEEERDAG